MRHSVPINCQHMLSVCEREIAAGRFTRAARIAQEFKNHVVESDDMEETQKYENVAYAWYIITRATLKEIFSEPTQRTYEAFRAFFVAHRMGFECFQKLLVTGSDDWDKDSEHYPYFVELKGFYDELYERCGEHADLERADEDANEFVALARNR